MTLVRANALSLPLRDESVDLVVTSPPYFALRSYQDGGEHYDGQIGSEDTPAAFLAALWAVLDECWRVLKPTGSVFVNLGDKYAGSGGGNQSGVLSHRNAALADVHDTMAARNMPRRYNQAADVLPKSLMLLPEQFRLGAVDPHFRAWKTGHAGPQWIARATIVWDKPNGLPESVTDRVRRSHEDWVHLTKRGRYFAAVDEIREAYTTSFGECGDVSRRGTYSPSTSTGYNHNEPKTPNPLGKLPGSVWEIPSEPLKVPDWLGVDHFAAYPQEWPRRIILGWTPTGWCTACGDARRAVVHRTPMEVRPTPRRAAAMAATSGSSSRTLPSGTMTKPPERAITGYACSCPDTTAPTRPAVVLDPFGGTGTTAMVARALGRYPVHVDLSADYLRLARWRIYDSGHAAKTLRRTNEEAHLSLLA